MRHVLSRLSLALVLLVPLACSGDDDDGTDEETTSSSTTTESPGPGFVDPDDDEQTSTTVTETTIALRPEGAVTENSLDILGDTLGIGDACAGRSAAGDIEYRYDLSNGGTLVLTLDEGAVVSAVYEGFSGRFEGSSITDISADDGFVTGSTPVSDGTTDSDLAYRATIPLRNCDTPPETTIATDATTSTTAA